MAGDIKVDVRLPDVIARVQQHADTRRKGAGPMLSESIWRSSYVGRDQMMYLIEQGLKDGLSPQQFGKKAQGFLLPGAKTPTRVKSDRVSNKPTTMAYNAFRLARTEIQQAYNEGRRAIDEIMVSRGVIVGTRWLLSATHKERVGYDVCDDRANLRDPNFAWLAKYGVDSRGVHEPMMVPLDHPNGLCLTVPVPTPRELIERELFGGPRPDAAPDSLFPPPPVFQTGPNTFLGNLGKLTNWLHRTAQNHGWQSAWSGRANLQALPRGLEAFMDWNGDIVLNANSKHVSGLANLFNNAEKALGEGQSAAISQTVLAGSQTIDAFRVLLHEVTHGINTKRSDLAYKKRYQKAFEEGLTEYYTRWLTPSWYRELTGIAFPAKFFRPVNAPTHMGNYSNNVDLIARLAEEIVLDEEGRAALVDKWKKLTDSEEAWDAMIDDLYEALRLRRKDLGFTKTILDAAMKIDLGQETGSQGYMKPEDWRKFEAMLDRLLEQGTWGANL